MSNSQPISLVDDDSDDDDMDHLFVNVPSFVKREHQNLPKKRDSIESIDGSSNSASSNSSNDRKGGPVLVSPILAASASSLLELGQWTVPLSPSSTSTLLVQPSQELLLDLAAAKENATSKNTSKTTMQVVVKRKSDEAIIGTLSPADAACLEPILDNTKKFHLTATETSTTALAPSQVCICFHAKTNWAFERKPLQETIKSHLKMKRFGFRPFESYNQQWKLSSTSANESAASSTCTSAAAAASSRAATVTPPAEHTLVPTVIGTCRVLVTGAVTNFPPSAAVDIRRVPDSSLVAVYSTTSTNNTRIGSLQPLHAAVVAPILDAGVYSISRAIKYGATNSLLQLTWTCLSDGNPVQIIMLQSALFTKLGPRCVLELSAQEYMPRTTVDGLSSAAATAAYAQVQTPLAAPSNSKIAPVDYDPMEASVQELLARLGGDEPVACGKRRADGTTDTDITVSTESWLSQQDELDKMFDKQSDEQLAKVPEYPMPALLDKVYLFDHQVDGIRWLMHQEQGNIPSYITESTNANGRKIWKCEITTSVFVRPPKPVRGGILADDMGIGKTLQTIGLILAHPPEGISSYPLPKNYPHRQRKAPRCTLIVCPKSVAANWKIEINKHVNRRKLNKYLVVDMYFGPKRDEILYKVNAGMIDVLITSFSTVASEFRQMEVEQGASIAGRPFPKKAKRASYLFDVEFHRIVLDEAHTIRNSKTHYFKSACALTSKRRLCLTGTPFVNNPSDLRSLLSFLEVDPLRRYKIFNCLVLDPIKDNRESGLRTIRTTMSFICLRRKKEALLDSIQLVSKVVHIAQVEFPDGCAHKHTYEVLYGAARAIFLNLLRTEGVDYVMSRFMELLALVLRIRQSCNHMGLVPKEYRERAGAVNIKALTMALDNEEGASLLDFLQGLFKRELVECVVCMNEMNENDAKILRACKHVFCDSCLNQISNHLCPLCRVPYTADDMIDKKTAEEAAKSDRVPFNAKKELKTNGRSPKFQAVIDVIDQMKPDEKGVIFSQWTSVLDLLEEEFKALGHTFTRIDGKMDADARVAAMEAFDTDGCDSQRTPRFILCSLMACGTGINLTRGNVAFMLDPWWNGAAESQAMDRIHRIGQTRPVRVYRFLMKDSIEERMVQLQESKAMLGKGTQERLTLLEKRKARLTFLKDLFRIEPEDTIWVDK